MIISDLNNLETVQGSEVVGGYKNQTKREVLVSDVKNRFRGSIVSNTRVRGNSATAEADALAVGPNTTSDTFSDVVVEKGKLSSSSSKSIAGTSGSGY